LLNELINNYFGFNKQQRNGLLVLVIISFVLLLLRISYPYFTVPNKIIIQNLPIVEQRLDSTFETSRHYTAKEFSANKKADTLFVFNPNTVSFQELFKLGFTKKTAQTLLKFRGRGFVFKQKSDLKKVYGISDNFYATLEPYILIEASKSEAIKNQAAQTKLTNSIQINKSQSIVELNAADSLTLIAIKGIEPTFAKRILKYRSVLGGYASIEQLKEVYGFTDELYEQVKSSFTLNTSLIKKLNINTDNFKTINKHPYLSYEITKAIFDSRRKTVINLTNLKDILHDDAQYQKLMPYLVFE
jgi:DNA uptake protein ComE-like DNA-binding protein